jgi:polar amino acid transport system substrate-binding protein
MLIRQGLVPALMALLFTATPCLAGSTLTLATGEWAPYVSENLPGKGFTTEIVQAACREAGLDVKLEFGTWSRASGRVEQDEIFAGYPYMPTEARAEFAWFSDPIAFSRNVLFYNKELNPGFRFKNVEQLKKYRVGGMRGYFYVDTFKKAGVDIDYTRKAVLSFKKLLHDRIDVFPSNELVGWSLVRKRFDKEKVSKLATSKKPLNEKKLTLMVSKDYPNARELMQRFNSGLAAIMESGEYQRIMTKHNVPQSVGGDS